MKDTVVKVSMTRILVAKDGTQENLLKAISDVAKAGVMAKTAKDAEIPMEGRVKRFSRMEIFL